MKRALIADRDPADYVAPRAGAWIETTIGGHNAPKYLSRPPRGGVD